jgi:hypothetical protein
MEATWPRPALLRPPFLLFFVTAGGGIAERGSALSLSKTGLKMLPADPTETRPPPKPLRPLGEGRVWVGEWRTVVVLVKGEVERERREVEVGSSGGKVESGRDESGELCEYVGESPAVSATLLTTPRPSLIPLCHPNPPAIKLVSRSFRRPPHRSRLAPGRWWW